MTCQCTIPGDPAVDQRRCDRDDVSCDRAVDSPGVGKKPGSTKRDSRRKDAEHQDRITNARQSLQGPGDEHTEGKRDYRKCHDSYRTIKRPVRERLIREQVSSEVNNGSDQRRANQANYGCRTMISSGLRPSAMRHVGSNESYQGTIQSSPTNRCGDRGSRESYEIDAGCFRTEHTAKYDAECERENRRKCLENARDRSATHQINDMGVLTRPPSNEPGLDSRTAI